MIGLREYFDLVERVNALDQTYYTDPDNCVVTDAEYDRLFDQLLEFEARFPDQVAHNSPTKRPGGKATFRPTEHAFPMLSLAKVTDEDGLSKFLSRFSGGGDLVVQPKYDGASLSLQYVDGELVTAITRGDGVVGDDVTANARCIRGVEISPGRAYTGVVRGEVVIPRSDFEEINAGDQFANCRNAAAGALRHSDPYEARRRRLVFIPYDHYDESGTTWVQLKDTLTLSIDLVPDAVKLVLEERDNLDYDTDGVVIKSLDPSVRLALGEQDRHPNWAVAYKTQGEVVETRLRGVIWQVGAGGGVTPVADLVPVECAGTVISRASLHNMKFIRDKGISVGDVVEITRAGDVIPYVLSSLGPGSGFVNSPIFAPIKCPECSHELEQRGNSGQIECVNIATCPAQVAERFVRWVGRSAADIDGMSIRMIQKLLDADLVSSVADLYRLTVDDFLSLPSVGKKTAEKMVRSIEDSKSVTLRKALVGFAIPNVGDGTAKRLVAVFETFDDIAMASVQDLESVKDIGPETARSIYSWVAENVNTVTDMRDLGVTLGNEAAKTQVTDVSSKAFVVTGSVPGYKSRSAFVELLESVGWVAQSSVSKKTDLLILEDPASTSSKAKKARELGVQIVTPAEAASMAGL